MNTHQGFTRIDTRRVTHYEPPMDDLEADEGMFAQPLPHWMLRAVNFIDDHADLLFWAGMGCVAAAFLTLAAGGWLPGAQ